MTQTLIISTQGTIPAAFPAVHTIADLLINGDEYFVLTSIYYSCVIAPSAGTIAGAVNVPKDCTIEAIGTQTSGSMVTASSTFIAATVQVLFTFPSIFVNLKSVKFLFTAMSATSGLMVVDYDYAVYTVFTQC